VLLILHNQRSFSSISSIIELMSQLLNGSLDDVLSSAPRLDLLMSLRVESIEKVGVLLS